MNMAMHCTVAAVSLGDWATMYGIRSGILVPLTGAKWTPGRQLQTTSTILC